MNFQIFPGKIKTKLLLFLVIISLSLTLLFPGVTKSQDRASVSIELNIDRCSSEELIVKLEDQKLFCLIEDKDERDLKSWKKKAEQFSKNIKSFADTQKNIDDLKLSNLYPLNEESKPTEQGTNKIKKAIKNYRINLLFSIQDYTDKCSEELIVKLDDRKLFCVMDTGKELPDKKHLKYWEKEVELLAEEAGKFSSDIKKFADKNKKENKIKIDLDEKNREENEIKNNSDEKNLLKESQRKNYYYLPIFYNESIEYFAGTYNKEIIRIGKHSTEKNISEEWEKYKCDWIKRGKEVRDKIRDEIKAYRESFKLAKQENKGGKGDEKNKGDKGDEEDKREQEKIVLSNQAVRIGMKPIFYIRTWNNGLSPTERADKVRKKIEKIVKGEIDIQGLGIFEKSIENTEIENTEDEKTIIQKPKIIKIISDSKFLSEEEKQIIEITDKDALFARIEGVENAADLAQDYLIKINKFVTEYKNSIKKANKKGYKRGYPVNFLNNPKPIFSINSGSGLFQASYRASLISKRIEKFAQKNLFLKLDRLVAAYPVGEELNSKDDKSKGLCILPESLKPEDYNKFLANNNPNNRNTNDCKIETLEANDNLALVYSDEISRKIDQVDWELTDLHIREKPGKYLDEGLPKTIIFMELDKDYEHIMNIYIDELDPFLHKNIETKQNLAIDFLEKIDDIVREYRNKNRRRLIIFIVLLLIVLQIFFRISPKSIKKVFSKKNKILKNTDIYLKFLFSKTIYFFRPNNDKIISLVLKLCILAVIVILILYNIPKYDIFIIDRIGIYFRFIEEKVEMVWAYLYTQIPSIVFILISVIILDQIILDKIIFVLDKKIHLKEDDNKDTSTIDKIIGNIIEKIIEKAGYNQQQLKEEQRQSNLIIFRTTIVICRIVLYIFAIILIAPHLPAAGTIYFKGISAFVVLAFTWSASSIIADLAAGLILIYGKSLKIGDWIKVEETIGEIREQNLLFHKIKTAKNCIITIPNSVIFNNFTTNFSASSKEESKLILHIPVGLGYDVPRKEIEKTLIAAARKTKNILKWNSDNSKDAQVKLFALCLFIQKKLYRLSLLLQYHNDAFVLITNLGDFAVTYELNVYTENPEQISQIYSDLYKNIQDECNSRGIEILSPSYLALRDGEDSTIPKE